MTEELELRDEAKVSRKRKLQQKRKKGQKKFMDGKGTTPKVKVNKKLKRLYKKRAAQYNSDGDEDAVEESAVKGGVERSGLIHQVDTSDKGFDSDNQHDNEDNDCDSDGHLDSLDENNASSEDDRDASHTVLKFSEGSHAFQHAFMKIMKKSCSSDLLGPVLSGHKNLIAKRLAEEVAEHKVKVDTKKERHLVAEKGHVKPEKFLDSKEKFLISVSTKGVVKLFNAVNKAQISQKSTYISKSKDARDAQKHNKETFLAELRKASMPTTLNPSKFNSVMGSKTMPEQNASEPGWDILRDGYMLTNPTLKDWDKMANPTAISDPGKLPLVSSSDEEWSYAIEQISKTNLLAPCMFYVFLLNLITSP